MSASLDVAVRGTSSAGPGRRLSKLGRSAGLWLVVIVVLLFAGAVITIGSADDAETRPMHYDSFRGEGTHAYAQLLRDHGADVETTESYDDAEKAAAQPGTAVVVLRPDSLPQDKRTSLGNAAKKGGHLVLVQPHEPERFDADILPAPQFDGPPDEGKAREPSCGLPAAKKAGPATAPAVHYSSTAADAAKCYPRTDIGKQASGLVDVPYDGGRITVAGANSWFANQTIAENGNASIAMGLVADADSVVLYWPSADSFPAAQDDGGLPDYIPDWAYFAALWLLVVAVVVLIWRGRRFGPLAAERLPVVVPAKETVSGHAGLMQRARARPEALRSIQQAAIISIARKLGLPASAPAEDVCRAAADRLGESRENIAHLLLRAQPQTDAELVSLAQAVRDIERRV